ncbi:hypothetical protein C5167_045001 [Papaver somniferum]|uniref:Protein kinase domain-containing protein n=1 Tax=Papaver somniferum TaxID=3469 RepID=A0A4Y7LDE1_PAPSO|nr:hypothetical protein C5167_045001 [Papaver somniferum]
MGFGDDGVVVLRRKKKFFVDENSQLKAIDFGLSDFVKPDKRLNDIVGSAYYVASEVLHRSYNTEADLWSIGVISYILLCGSCQFLARTEERRDLLKLLTMSLLLDKNVKVETPQKLGTDGKKGGAVRQGTPYPKGGKTPASGGKSNKSLLGHSVQFTVETAIGFGVY